MKFLIILWTFYNAVSYADSLECLQCDNIEHPNTCNVTTECHSGQLCGTGSPAVSIVGKRQTLACHECCSTNNCNNKLCEHSKPSACVDSVTVDCALLHSLFNVCSDVQHAKSVCPRFCGLCSLVDGDWATWGAWSGCDVTCESGTQVRIRTCTNPEPANGGVNCVGDSTQHKQCTKQLCPVHGGWSGWSGWSPCSATCDVGMSQRGRSCTNPKPSRAGDYCPDMPQQFKICTAGPCSTWMDWGSWTSCSVTCGVGLQRRYRNCTSTSSILGIGCVGSNDQTETCSNSTCVQVAFNAHGHQALSGSVITFPTVILNEGNAFNETSGLFTAPFSGNYFFSAQVCGQTRQNIFFNIKKSNTDMSTTYLTSAYGYDQGSYPCSPSSVVTKLHVGDHVWVYMSSGLGSLYDSGTNYWCSFTGSLLSVSG
ncbi:hemicentin-1-like isoform X2 [Mya arenaria]|uniref:hemicentin-1-like isoform X2 n=1 Tax=Mya arenaria TaxID=6604 RepID=UPI0022E50471|nr:hemicentin-1-like isoform X2 [Mya arenaria]